MELTTLDIMKLLPHRYPFLLVDRITEFEVGKPHHWHEECDDQ